MLVIERRAFSTDPNSFDFNCNFFQQWFYPCWINVSSFHDTSEKNDKNWIKHHSFNVTHKNDRGKQTLNTTTLSELSKERQRNETRTTHWHKRLLVAKITQTDSTTGTYRDVMRLQQLQYPDDRRWTQTAQLIIYPPLQFHEKYYLLQEPKGSAWVI